MQVVIDTNILVSGLLNPYGPSGRIVDLLVISTIQAVFDDRILIEYKEVLLRPKFGFSEKHVDAFLDHVIINGIQVSAPPLPNQNYPDPDDLPFAEVAVAGGVRVLVTGNGRHFEFLENNYGVTVLSPRDFIDSIGGLLARQNIFGA